MLVVLRGSIFADKLGNLIHLMFMQIMRDFGQTGQYSWGRACLVWLYHQLCKATQQGTHEMGKVATLLQVWALDRFTHITLRRPRERLFVPYYPFAHRWRMKWDTTQQATYVVWAFREAFNKQTTGQVQTTFSMHLFVLNLLTLDSHYFNSLMQMKRYYGSPIRSMSFSLYLPPAALVELFGLHGSH